MADPDHTAHRWLSSSSAREPAGVVWISESLQAGGLTSSATLQAQIQGSELAYHNIYIVCERLGLVKDQCCCYKAIEAP